jgi:Uma2 family endonuclease
VLGGELQLELRVHDGPNWIVPDLLVVPRQLLVDGVKVVDIEDVVLIVEILSPSTKDKDFGPKRELCERNNTDYWVVTPGDPWGHITSFGFGTSAIQPPTPRPR